jgi:polysaccharide transporter, PST family
MSGTNEAWTNLLPETFRGRLHGRVQLQKILSNIVWLSLDKVVRLALGAVVGIWMARELGPAQFGILNYAIAFAALFAPLASLGLDSIVVRDILIQDPSERGLTLGTAFTMRLAGGILGAATATATIVLFRPSDGLAIALVALSGIALSALAFDVIDLWFQSQVKAKFAIYAKNAAFLLLTGVRLVLLFHHAPVIAFGWAALGEAFLSAAALAAVYWWRGGRFREWTVRFDRARTFLLDSWPLAFANLAAILYMRIGQVMLGSMLGDRDVGIYSVAVRLAEAWYFIPVAIVASVYPAILKAKRESEEHYLRQLRLLYGVLNIVSLPVAAVTSFVSSALIRVLFGVQYIEAGPVLAVYVWASLPVFLTIASNQYLIAENRTRVALFRTLAGSVVNILLNLVLIPRFGTTGAAVAALTAYSVAALSMGVTKDLRAHLLMMVGTLNPRWIISELRRLTTG